MSTFMYLSYSQISETAHLLNKKDGFQAPTAKERT